MAPLKDELDKVIFAMVELSNKWQKDTLWRGVQDQEDELGRLGRTIYNRDTDAKSFDNLNQAYQETDKLGTMDFEEWIHRFQLWRDRYQELQEWTEPK